MQKTGNRNLVCEHGHGCLYPVPQAGQLPLALRAVYRGGIPCQVFPSTQSFTIAGR